VHLAPALPIRNDVKLATKVKSPRREDTGYCDYKNATKAKKKRQLPKAAEAAAAGTCAPASHLSANFGRKFHHLIAENPRLRI
jgi:hypothetical protein